MPAQLRRDLFARLALKNDNRFIIFGKYVDLLGYRLARRKAAGTCKLDGGRLAPALPSSLSPSGRSAPARRRSRGPSVIPGKAKRNR